MTNTPINKKNLPVTKIVRIFLKKTNSLKNMQLQKTQTFAVKKNPHKTICALFQNMLSLKLSVT